MFRRTSLFSKSVVIAAAIMTSSTALLSSCVPQQSSFAGDEQYRFSGRKQLEEQKKQEAGQQGTEDQSVPQLQAHQEDPRLAKIPGPPPPWVQSSPPQQQAGQAGTSAAQTRSALNNHQGEAPGGGLPQGTLTPLPGGGPKLGVGPVGPGGTSRATERPDEGVNRYSNRPPSWESLNEIDDGRNQNAPGENNTSVASGYNIFGTTTVPFAVGPIDTSPK